MNWLFFFLIYDCKQACSGKDHSKVILLPMCKLFFNDNICALYYSIYPFRVHKIFRVVKWIECWKVSHSALEGSNLPQKSVTSLWCKKRGFCLYIYWQLGAQNLNPVTYKKMLCESWNMLAWICGNLPKFELFFFLYGEF